MVAENHPVREVLKKVVAESSINADQVHELERFVRDDWVIDENEAKFLFRVNQALGDNEDDCAEWTKFYITSISRLVVMDMNTPGQIDASEGDWLAEMLEEYAVDNDSQTALLNDLQKTTTSIEGKLAAWIEARN